MEELKPYVGKGVFLGMTREGNPVVAYFVTGRSDPSRNRVLLRDNARVYTEPTQPLHAEDQPDLLVYDAMVWEDRYPITRDGIIAVSNGKHTHQIVGRWFTSGQNLTDSLKDWNYEPDSKDGNYTARVSGRMVIPAADGQVRKLELGIIRRGDDSPIAIREHFEIIPERGMGHLLTTYCGNALAGCRLPPFMDKPTAIPLEDAVALEDIEVRLRPHMGDPEFFVGSAVLRYTIPGTERFACKITNRIPPAS